MDGKSILSYESSQAVGMAEARKLFLQKEYSESLKLYEAMLDLNPGDPALLVSKAACFLQLRKLEEARSFATEGLQRMSSRVEKAKALSVIARSFMNEKDYQKAVEYFQQALLEHNNDAVANVLRKAERSLQKQEKKLSLEFGAKALVHFEEQDFLEAIKCYTLAINKSSGNSLHYLNRAKCYLRLSLLEKALEDAEKCRQLDSTLVGPYLVAGECLQLMKEADRAVEMYDAGLFLDPDNVKLKEGLKKVLEGVTRGDMNPENEREEPRFTIESLLEGGDHEEIVQVGTIPLLRISFRRLIPETGWLDDEVINGYFELLKRRLGSDVHFFNTFFFPLLASKGYERVRRWSRQVDLFSCSLVFVPVHLGAHWTLAVVDLPAKCVNYFDSLGCYGGEIELQVLQAYLQDEHRERKKTELDLSDWNFGAAEGIPKQLNGSDCGVFVCKFAEYLAERRTLDWDGRDMPRFREEMALVLANYRN